jgi:hypothetical protein
MAYIHIVEVFVCSIVGALHTLMSLYSSKRSIVVV